MRVFLVSALMAASCFGQAFGTWKMNVARSTFLGTTQPRSLTARIEPHSKGEAFTLIRIEPDGRTRSSSTILYFDGSPRDFEDFECSGTQSSRRLHGETVEILRQCGPGEWTRLIRRTSAKPNELVLEITEQHHDGRRFARQLVFEKQ